MRAQRIRLRNFKCYAETDLSLSPGVTVVHGVNGSGKSTLLEAVFFALYGSKALDERTLADVITTGEDETEVELWFTHDGTDFSIERQVKRRGERATTTRCVLDSSEGTIEGARDVRREVTRLLRMDADAFVNCAYVRQGEVNKLIHASPSDRQDMIDDLLQLGSLEEYRERASDARLGVKTVLDGQREVLETLREQVQNKVSKALHDRLNELETRLSDVSGSIDRFESQREEAIETRDAATDVLERHEETREEIAQLEEDIETLRTKITETDQERESISDAIREKRDRCDDLETEREEIIQSIHLEDESIALDDMSGDPGDGLADLEAVSVDALIDSLETEDERRRETLEELRLSIQEQSSERDRLRDRAQELEADADEKRETAETLDEKVATDEATIDERAETLEELDREIETLRDQFEDEPIQFGNSESHRNEIATEREACQSDLADVSARIDTTEAAIEDAQSLLDAGKCPECGQPVEDSPHVDVLEERREELDSLIVRKAELEEELDSLEERLERADELLESERRIETLETNRNNVSQLLSEKRETLSERRQQRDELREQAREFETEAEQMRSEAEEIEQAIEETRTELGTINSERSELREILESLRRASEVAEEIDSLATEVETLRENRSSKAELNDERRDRLAEKRDRKRDLESAFDEESVEQARSNLEEATDYIEKVDAKLDELETQRTELQNEIGAVENEIEELEALRDRQAEVEDRCDALESVYEEAETLQSTYGDLRSELRQRNVETLERLLNETFDLVYQNDSYASIDLDGLYRLTIYQKDGEPLEPEQLSGGERALFNLSLRCAIYRLLAESVDGAPAMPPLILDEPTVFLDSGHVTQLVSLVESMRDLGVEQIVLVSHDEELVGAADDLVRVRKDPTSNRSRLERGESPEMATLSLD